MVLTTFEVRQLLGLHETLESLNAYLDSPDIRGWSDKRRILEMNSKGKSALLFTSINQSGVLENVKDYHWATSV